MASRIGSGEVPLGRLLAEVPAYQQFATVDEQASALRAVAEAHPERCSLRRVGTSRLGEPLHCLRIDGGPRQALVFGGPHPNEPIGCLASLHLAWTMCADGDLREQLGFTWHVIPCVDPDGMRLNEGWLHGPFTRTHYGRHFYRPAPEQQVEWTFPFAYKEAYFDRVLPETLALMRLIDELQPALMCSLHNNELGGAYFYLSGPAPPLYPALHEVAARCGIPLELGEPEMPYLEQFANAIFRMSRSEDAYEFALRVGTDPLARTAGSSSTAYAARHGTFSLATEAPYWSHPDIADLRPAKITYSSALEARAAGLRDLGERLVEAVKLLTPVRSPFALAVQEFGPSILRTAQSDLRRSQDPGADRPATVAEAFSCADHVHSFRLRYGGMLLRALDAEIAIGNGTPGVRAQRAELGRTYDSWCEEAEQATPATAIPIRDIVGLEYGAILAAASFVGLTLRR